MTQFVIRERDFLFIFQIFFPLCDTSLSGIREEKQLPYYSEVEKCSNLYAYQIGLGGYYGHVFKPVKLPEIFFHDGCILKDGVRDVTSVAIYCYWHMGTDYNDDIAHSIKYWRWIQMKIVNKLCNN